MTNTPYSNGHLPHDYHMHSNVSCDSRVTMAEMCRTALSKGIPEIALTDHFDLHPRDHCAGYYNPAAYFEQLEAARREFGPQGLTIRAGVEVGEYHRWGDEIQPVLEAWPYDYVLGSMHWVGNKFIFDVGFFHKRSPEEAFTAYFTELAAMVRTGGFDVLAHADVPKRAAHTAYGRFDIAEWEDLMRPVWQACIENRIGIEINTSGLRQAVGQTLPSLEALRWYRAMGGELLTVGSDAHRTEHVGFGLATALDLAREAGFTRLCSYEQREVVRWIEI